MKSVLTGVLLAASCSFAGSPEQIQAHLLLDDLVGAQEAFEQAIAKMPSNPSLYEAGISVAAHQGDKRSLLKYYRKWLAVKSEQQDERPLIEHVAWGVLQSSAKSPMVTVRILTTIAGALCQDHRGALLVIQGLKDGSGIVRATAAQAAASYQDACVAHAIVAAYRKEGDWRVRMELLRAISRQRITEMREELIQTLHNPTLSFQERALAVEAVVNMTETLSLDEIASLVSSDRAGLRLLAIAVIDYLNEKKHEKILISLVKDSNPEVALSALKALKSRRVIGFDPEFNQLLQQLMGGAHFELSLAAAQLGMVVQHPHSEKTFRRWIKSHLPQHQAKAISALNETGEKGQQLLREIFPKIENSIAKANAALGLFQCRGKLLPKELNAVNKSLVALLNTSSRLKFEQGGVVDQRWDLSESLLNDAVAIDLKTRLKLVQFLSIIDVESAKNALKGFLSKKRWEVSGNAVVLMLQEGEEDARELVEQLMEDEKSSKIGIQAALILALFSHDVKAVEHLIAAYAKADRNLKERILEGLVSIGHERALPFLVDRMEESSETIQLLAATAAIQTLYH